MAHSTDCERIVLMQCQTGCVDVSSTPAIGLLTFVVLGARGSGARAGGGGGEWSAVAGCHSSPCLAARAFWSAPFWALLRFERGEPPEDVLFGLVVASLGIV